MYINISADRQSAINQAIESALKQIAVKNAEREADYQAWLQNASPAEKMRMKRDALIDEKRRADAEYQRASRRVDGLLGQMKYASMQKWRLKWGMDNHYEPDKRKSLDEEFMEARQRLDEANARIEREVDEEINAGETSCC